MRPAEILLKTADWIEAHIEDQCASAVDRHATGHINMVTQSSTEQRYEAVKAFGRYLLEMRVEEMRWVARQLDKPEDGIVTDAELHDDKAGYVHVTRAAPPQPSGHSEPTSPSARPPWTGTCPVLGCPITKEHTHRVGESIVYPNGEASL